MIPSEAVKRGKDQEANFVWVSQGKGKKAEKREVKLGMSDDVNVEVVSGIDENDTLVIKAKKPNTAVKSTQAKTNPFMPVGGRR